MEGRSRRGQLAAMQSVLLLFYTGLDFCRWGHEDGEAGRKVTDTVDTGCPGV